MKGSLITLTFFVAGWLAGFSGILPATIDWNEVSNWALYLLMTLAGITIGADPHSWEMLTRMNLKIILVPLGVIAGTLIGSAAISFLIPSLTLRESMAVGSGFGYYSLSSIMISQMHSELLGVTALLSNLMREIFTLIATPLLVVWFGKLAGIASGGATAMDTTLPVITHYSGKEFALISLFSGIVLTTLVPVLVTLILSV